MSKPIQAAIALALATAAPCFAQGTITEYPSPTANSAPYGITVGPDGNLWFAEYTGNKIATISTAGVFTEFTLPNGGGPTSLVTGPDSNIWFTEYFGDKIGRITPTGVITEFGLTSGSGAQSITLGPDGNIWFTENTADKVGRITPLGVITEFPMPSGSRPFGIVSGPDGNVWVTLTLAHTVASITPAGIVSEYTVSGNPAAITLGPDGNLWFSENLGNTIGQITPTGAVTQFAIPDGDSSVYGITAGPDGSLWFTGTSQIGRITTTGAITKFPIPTISGYAIQITGGPDGNLWFTEYNGNSVAKIVPQPDKADIWIGLKNSDDQGTQFDVRVEISRNGSSVSNGESRCITGVTRSAASAKEVKMPFAGSMTGFAPGDSLSVKIFTRIGTNPDNSKCSGPGGSHSSAVGLRLYYDSTDRSSGVNAAVGSNAPTSYYLHSAGSNFFLDTLAPLTTTAKTKDSASLNFAGGNPWKEIGTWNMTLP